MLKTKTFLRFKGFDGEWESKKLGDISNIKTGSKDLKDKNDNGKYPFYVRSQKIEKINSFSYDGEAILIPGDGRIGDIFHYINGKFDYHQRVYKISDTKEWLKFIYYLFQKNIKKHLMTYSAKATVDSLRLPMLLNFKLSVPSVNEQQKIASLFTSLDNLIEYTEIKINKLKNLKDSLLTNMFVDDINKLPRIRFKGFYSRLQENHLKDLFLIKSGFSFPEKYQIKDNQNNNISFFKVLDLKNKYKNNSTFYINRKIALENYKIFNDESIAFAKVGEACKLNRKIMINLKEYLVDNNMSLLFDKDNKNNFIYLYYLIDRLNFCIFVNNGALPSISFELLKYYKVKIPSISEQQKIGNTLKLLDEIISNNEIKLNKLQNLKSSLLHHMFVK